MDVDENGLLLNYNSEKEMKNLFSLFTTLLTDKTARFTKIEIDRMNDAVNLITELLKNVKFSQINDDDLLTNELDYIEDIEIDEKDEHKKTFLPKNKNIIKFDRIVLNQIENDFFYTNENDFKNNEAEDVDAVCDDEEKNTPHVNLKRFLNPEETFLKIKKTAPFFNNPSFDNEILIYPLGVIFDELRREWFICEQSNKIIKINVSHVKEKKGVFIVKDRILVNPTALTILKEGASVAVLCSKLKNRNYWITIFSHHQKTGGYFKKFCSYDDPEAQMIYPCRGIARTKNHNLMTVDLPPMPQMPPRLRIFTINKRQAKFELKKAVRPSFIASCGERVAITDLATQIVFILNVDDSNWEALEKNPRDCIVLMKLLDNNCQNIPREPRLLADLSVFNYVSGVQFDNEGNLMIGDAGGQTIKLFDKNYNFVQRFSSDFPIPYMSSFFVNRQGQVIIINIHGRSKFVFGKLTACAKQLEWIPGAGEKRMKQKSRFSRFKSIK